MFEPPELFLELQPGRTFGQLNYSIAGSYDAQLDFRRGNERYATTEEEVRVAFNLVNSPKDSGLQTLGDIFMVYNGTVRPASFSVVPNDLDDPFSIHPDVVKKNEGRLNPPLLMTAASLQNVTVFFTPDAKGFYEIIIVMQDACNEIAIASVNVTVACSVSPVAAATTPLEGHQESFEGRGGKALRNADWAHPKGWFPPFHLNATPTQVVDNVREVEITETDGSIRTVSFREWADAPEWDAPFRDHGFLYKWSILMAPAGSNIPETVAKVRSQSIGVLADGTKIEAAFALANGTVPEIVGDDRPVATFIPDVVGFYDFKIEVSSACEASTFTTQILFGCNTPPNIAIESVEADLDLCLPKVRLSAAPTTDAEDDVLYHRWKPTQGFVASAILGAVGGHPNASNGILLENTEREETSFNPDATGVYNSEVEVSDGCLAPVKAFEVEVLWSNSCSNLASTVVSSVTLSVILYVLLVSLIALYKLYREPTHPLDPKCISEDIKRLSKLEILLEKLRFEKLTRSKKFAQELAKRQELAALQASLNSAMQIEDDEEREEAVAAANTELEIAAFRKKKYGFALNIESEAALLPASVHLWRGLLVFSIFVEWAHLLLLLFLPNVRLPQEVTESALLGNLSLPARAMYQVHFGLQVYLFTSIAFLAAAQAKWGNLVRDWRTSSKPGSLRGSQLKKAKRGFHGSDRPDKGGPGSGKHAVLSDVLVAQSGAFSNFQTFAFFNAFVLVEIMYVPILHNSFDMLTCSYSDQLFPFPHLAKDEKMRCWREEHILHALWAAAGLVLLYPAGLAFLFSAAQRIDLRVRELPHFSVARLALKYVAVFFSVFFGMSERTRIAPLGPYGVPDPELADGSGWGTSPAQHASNDTLHLLAMVSVSGALLLLTLRLQPLRGRGGVLNCMRASSYGTLLFMSIIAFDLTLGTGSSSVILKPGTTYRGLTLATAKAGDGPIVPASVSLSVAAILFFLLNWLRTRDMCVPDTPMNTLLKMDRPRLSQSSQVITMMITGGQKSGDIEQGTAQVQRWQTMLEEDPGSQVLVWVKVLQVCLSMRLTNYESVSQLDGYTKLREAALGFIGTAAHTEEGLDALVRSEAGTVIRFLLHDPASGVRVAACRLIQRLTELPEGMQIIMNTDGGNWKNARNWFESEDEDLYAFLKSKMNVKIAAPLMKGVKLLRFLGLLGMQNWIHRRWTSVTLDTLMALTDCVLDPNSYVAQEGCKAFVDIIMAATGKSLELHLDAEALAALPSADDHRKRRRRRKTENPWGQSVDPMIVVMLPRYRLVEAVIEAMASPDSVVRTISQDLFTSVIKNDTQDSLSLQITSMLTDTAWIIRLRALQATTKVYSNLLAEIAQLDQNDGPVRVNSVVRHDMLSYDFFRELGRLVGDPEEGAVREGACTACKNAWEVVLAVGTEPSSAEAGQTLRESFFMSGILEALKDLVDSGDGSSRTIAGAVLSQFVEDEDAASAMMSVDREMQRELEIRRSGVIAQIGEQKTKRLTVTVPSPTPRSPTKMVTPPGAFASISPGPATPSERWERYSESEASPKRRVQGSPERPAFTETETGLEDEFISHTNLRLQPPKPGLEVRVPPRLARDGFRMDQSVREPSIATAATRHLENEVLKPFDNLMASREAETGTAARSWTRGSRHALAQERARAKQRAALNVLHDPRDGVEGRVPWQKRMADYILAGSGASGRTSESAEIPEVRRGQYERGASYHQHLPKSELRILDGRRKTKGGPA